MTTSTCAPVFVSVVEPRVLNDLLSDLRPEKVLLIDGRSFLCFNGGHIKDAKNFSATSSLMKRRLAKISISEMLHLAAEEAKNISYAVVYDEGSESMNDIASDSFLHLVISKLVQDFPRVLLLKGGFSKFALAYPQRCSHAEPKPAISQSCLSPLDVCTNAGITQLFPHVYLGSEQDALSEKLLETKGIDYVLNVSVSCPKADFIKDSHFMRIPVNDTFSDKLITHFIEAFQFLDKVRKSEGCALVHCMAGVSRSPTLAIAYVMNYMNLPYDEAYRFVKEKRPSISPNFNFLGQLVEFDKCLKDQNERFRGDSSGEKSSKCSGLIQSSCKRQRLVSSGRNSARNSLTLNLAVTAGLGCDVAREDLSPSSVIQRLTLT